MDPGTAVGSAVVIEVGEDSPAALAVERYEYPELERLKYDEYWKKQYGYE
ncbi:MAG: hypothetical protein P8163_10365 [Candidatus Thiodiazotropha sp.]